MQPKRIITSLAKVVVATLFGGPIAGGQEAALQAVDLVGQWLGREGGSPFETALRRLEGDLEQLARAEAIEQAQVEHALEGARSIILVYGLSVAEIAELNLNPERTSTEVLRRGAGELAQLDEPARELCSRAVESLYRTVLAHSVAIPELERAFQRVVLARLDEIGTLPANVVSALQGAVASAALVDPTRQWHPDLYPPSTLLRAEFGVVPFYGRRDALAGFSEWSGFDRRLAVRLYTGAGGIGKTRLMLEVCRRLAAQGETAGFLHRDVGAANPAPMDALLGRSESVLMVVDYAETRRRDVHALLARAVAGGAPSRIRVVLLARAVAEWWHDLQREGDGVGDVLLGPATTVERLPPLADGLAERDEVFRQAAGAFAAALGEPGAMPAPAVLGAEHFKRVLFIHLAALAGVQGEGAKSERELLDFALRREQAFWDEGVAAAGLDVLRGRPIAEAAAVATLAGRAADRAEAVRLISDAPLLQGQPAAILDQAAELLHRLYPGQAWLQGVQPDVLGEHLVGRSLEQDPALLQVVAAHAG